MYKELKVSKSSRMSGESYIYKENVQQRFQDGVKMDDDERSVYINAKKMEGIECHTIWFGEYPWMWESCGDWRGVYFADLGGIRPSGFKTQNFHKSVATVSVDGCMRSVF
jgi:hypothetical protein